jgi:hypothetical protein
MLKTILLICLLLFSGCAPVQTNKQNSNFKSNLKDCALIEENNNIDSLVYRDLKREKVGCGASPKKNKIVASISDAIVKYPKGVFKDIALETCKEAIRVRLYSPSSFKEDISKTTIKVIAKRRATVKIPFAAETGLGKINSQVGYCIIDSDGKVLVLNITDE